MFKSTCSASLFTNPTVPPHCFFLLRDLPLKSDRLVKLSSCWVSGEAATDRKVDLGALTDDWTLKLSPARQKNWILVTLIPKLKHMAQSDWFLTMLHHQFHMQRRAPLFSELLCPCPEPAPEALEIRRGRNIRAHPTKRWSRRTNATESQS